MNRCDKQSNVLRLLPSTRNITADDVKPRELSSVQLPEAHVHGSSTYQRKSQSPSPTRPLALPPFNLPETLPNVSRYITQIILDVTMESIVKTCMERDWCSVVQAGQVVKVKMQDKVNYWSCCG